MANNPCGFIVHCYHSSQTFDTPSLYLSFTQWPQGSAADRISKGWLCHLAALSASLTQLTPIPSLFQKRGAMCIILLTIVPPL